MFVVCAFMISGQKKIAHTEMVAAPSPWRFNNRRDALYNFGYLASVETRQEIGPSVDAVNLDDWMMSP